MRLNRFAHLFTYKGKYWSFNSFNGNLINMDQDTYKYLLSGDIDKINEGSRTFLINTQFIVPDDYDELKAYNDLIETNKSSDWLSLTIAVTMDCNFNCYYCYEKDYRRHSKMSETVQKAVVQFAKRMIRPNSGMSITWYGGEPLLAADVIENLSYMFERAGFQLHDNSIITNGYLLTDSNARMLSSVAGVTTVQVTIDGTKDIHDKRRTLEGGQGTYDAIVQNIKDNAHYFRQINVRINADKSNLKDVANLIKTLKEECPPNVYPYFSLVRADNGEENEDYFNDKEYADAFMEHLYIGNPLPRPYYGCTATMENGWGIDPEGNLYKCWEETGNTKHIVGNVFEGVTDYKRYSKWLSYGLDAFPEQCKACAVLPTCGAGYCPLRILFPEESAVGLQCQPQKWYLQRMLEYWIDNNTGKQTSKVTCSQYNANDFWQRTALFYSWLWNKAKENFKENIQSLQTSLTKKE